MIEAGESVNFGMILIWLALILGFGAALSSVKCCLDRARCSSSLSKKLESGCTAVVTLCLVLLSYYLFDVRAAYSYVFQHSSADLEWYYRLSALWAGQEGSLLLWAWAILMMLLLVRYTGSAKKIVDTRLMDVTRAVSLVVVAFFLVLIAIKNPFSVYHLTDLGTVDVTYWNPFAVAYDVPYGQGMNPLLRNPWMAIHPPVLFLGYAAFTIPFAAAFANLLTGDNRWTKIASDWMRVAWLFLTLGIGLGGFWAYEVLGWGAWYWTWDPVETSSLIPWLTSTAYLHAHTRADFEEYGFLAPMLAVFSFILVIFATFVTRSGMWASVHSWQDFSLDGMIIAIFLVALLVSSTFLLFRRYLSQD